MSRIDERRTRLSRKAILSGAGLAAAELILGSGVLAEPRSKLYRRPENKEYPLYDEATASVTPPAGYQSRIALKKCITRLVRHGVISRDKYRELEKYNGPLPSELSNVLKK